MKIKIVRNQMGKYRVLIKTWNTLGWTQAYSYTDGCGLETKTILTIWNCGKDNQGSTHYYEQVKGHSLPKILKTLKDYEEGKEKRVKENTWTEIPMMSVDEGMEFEKCLEEIS